MNEQSEIHKAWVALKGSVTYGMSEIAPWVNMFHVPGGDFANGEYWITHANYCPKPYASFVCTAVGFAEYCEIMKEKRPSEKMKVALEEADELEKRMDIIGQNGNDGLHYDNAAQQVESLAGDSKPVFTQSMYENGDTPKVGSKVTLFKKTHSKIIDEFLNEELTVIGVTKGLDGHHVITLEHEHLGLCCGVYLDEFFKPTQSPREKFIAEFINLIHYCDENEIIADDVYKAGYRKLTPEHAKMYDDKTDFFRRGL